jgi:hypothetical protein
VFLNLSDGEVEIDQPGVVALSTSRALDGQSATGVSLAGWEGVVVSPS